MKIPNVRSLTVKGIACITLFLATFGVWSTTAPLHGASIASGTVTVDSQRKTIQHLEGGIIQSILIKEGDVVIKNQPLIILDNTIAKADLERLNSRYHYVLAKEARLTAERDGHDNIEFDHLLLDQQNDQRVSEILKNQNNLFQTNKNYYQSQRVLLSNQLEKNNAEYVGQKRRYSIEKRRLSIIQEELVSNQKLAEKGYVSKNRMLELAREEATMQSTINFVNTEIVKFKKSVEETKAQLNELEITRAKEIAESLRDTYQERYALEEQITSAKDVLKRLEITAPLSGTVINLQVFSQDGVITPSQNLLEIVPIDEKMIIEARVNPQDIDQISANMTAKIRLTAFNMRSIKPFDGTLETISADRLIDEQTGAAYYLARVSLVEDQPDLVSVTVYPGMQAEVMLLTEARTPIEYLTKPLINSFNRAFREE